jgi:hypothetical protein
MDQVYMNAAVVMDALMERFGSGIQFPEGKKDGPDTLNSVFRVERLHVDLGHEGQGHGLEVEALVALPHEESEIWHSKFCGKSQRHPEER